MNEQALWRIHPIVVGSKVFDQGMMTYQHAHGSPYAIPIYVWYLEPLAPGSQPKVLVDTGEMSPVQSEDREKAIGGRIYTFEDGLAQFGLKPEDIDIVIHTHLHNDHCENDFKCVNAVFYAHAKELERIHDPHPLDYRYNEEFIEEVEEAGKIQVVTEDREILPGISVIHTPAHTEGGLTVLIDTSAGRAAITGFCVIDENLHPPKSVTAMEMEVIPPGTNINPCLAYDQMVRVKGLADILLPLHEPRYAGVASIP
ncbi:Metallo-beta-lactamase superfamily protein [Desulfonatronum thiosulfatophilum]|uniref:Metallo-beta-lactamase superfamily protein n=1 Tax=Desulfonatronum thiosulfatophilum TaxID=617002 RepID=A0A1G6EG77_9BACT|nr:N-acyl homoserine lactonase family protein [Desulfonatronum thiosulfatophilum]SDB56479.1 Metallo-beta-lactamase superfamily protein [Desulfonatronum thiosulfatophilum]